MARKVKSGAAAATLFAAREKLPRRDAMRLLALMAGTLCAMMVIMIIAVTPERLNLSAGDIAPRTITATKDVVDEITTNKMIRLAEQNATVSYANDNEAAARSLEKIDNAFDRLDEVRVSAANAIALLTASLGDGKTPSDAQITETLSDAQLLGDARRALSPVELSDTQLRTLQLMDADRLNDLRVSTARALRVSYATGIQQGSETTTLNSLEDTLTRMYDFDATEASIARNAAEPYLDPSQIIDEETTAANRQAAREAVEPVVFKKGQNIVVAGEAVTLPQISMLQNLGLLADDSIDMMMYLGIAILLAVLLCVIVMYIYCFESAMLRDFKSLLLMCIIMVVSLTASLVVREINVNMMPLGLCALMMTLLLKPRLAMTVNTVMAILLGLISAGTQNDLSSYMMINVIVSTFISGTLCIYMSRWRTNRLGVISAGVASGVASMISMLATGFINNTDVTGVASRATWALAGGALTAILCLGFQPVLEAAFKLMTPSKLMELSNPQQPLLRRLLLEAPGTYHHSIIVANLAEAAADAIGANGLLARVGAYYHDVGKLKRPLYFKENQMGDNPHDRTDPRISTAILTAHPRDGVMMAQKYRMPQQVLDIIAQHHGDTPVVYFYNKAMKASPEEPVDIADFRYDGPKPQTCEAAIVMLADTVEAAARALPNPTPERIDELIRSLVKGKTDDRQLDECTLTFRQVDTICRVFEQVLSGVFHQRIAYPKIDIPNRGPVDIPAPSAGPIAGAPPATSSGEDIGEAIK
ncbi:MAG: HDIG domain-containing protein [Clostridiales bacterium]|nr:HDIG domain-containing protein [Clostridiales bacterium]